jgi:hypothetical protein
MLRLHSKERILNLLTEACNRRVWAYYFVLIMAISGCSSTTVFTAYPSKINPIIHDLSAGKPVNLAQSLTGERESSDQILYNMERGRTAHVMGDLDVSMKDFNSSIVRIKQNDQKATISASAIGAYVAANVTNDNAIPYVGDGYERVLLHHYQALNYLFKRDIEGAGVEFRLANREQEEALKQFAREIEDAQQEAEQKRTKNSEAVVEQKYAQMDEVAGRVKNSFQNAYSFYLSGFVYELNKLPNDAYIDYKRALEIYPHNRYLQKDVLRLAAALEMNEDLDALRSRFRIDPAVRYNNDARNNGELLVIYEDGFVPQKKEIKIPLPIPTVGLVAIAFPIYDSEWTPQIPLTINESNILIGSTETICDFRVLAVKALKEKAPIIATRQVIRAIAKGIQSKTAEKKAGTLGLILDGIWNYLSENADLRSWLTLPSNAQILRVSLPAGTHKLLLERAGINDQVYADVEISTNGKTVLHVIRAGNQFYTTSILFPS